MEKICVALGNTETKEEAVKTKSAASPADDEDSTDDDVVKEISAEELLKARDPKFNMEEFRKLSTACYYY